VTFLIFESFTWNTTHIRSFVLKILGIQLNTFELNWARPWSEEVDDTADIAGVDAATAEEVDETTTVW